jgi:hypothetical protein
MNHALRTRNAAFELYLSLRFSNPDYLIILTFRSCVKVKNEFLNRVFIARSGSFMKIYETTLER